MRTIVRLVACVGIALTAAGCDPETDRVFFRQGIGTELNSGNIEASTKAQNDYVQYVCQQAGLSYIDDGGSITCENPNKPSTWQLFVQAGMNDIDQRCDAYLLWLDYVRRANDPTLRVLSDAATYSALIMDRAGVGPAPIAIAGAAFGFAKNTFTNVMSRLILEVNHSAVQSVVLSAQKQFREDLLGSTDKKIPPVVIASKPAAIYALRSYLRLCMPVTIEAEINNTVVTFARGGPAGLADQEPLVSGRNVSVTTITNVNAPVPPGSKAPAASSERNGDIEIKLTDKTVTSYQNALCVTPANGKLGLKTRAAVSEYLTLRGEKDTSAQFDRRTPGLLQDAVDKVRSCRGTFLMNVYEVVNYGIPANRVQTIRSLQDELNKALKAKGSTTTIPITGQFTDDSQGKDQTRNAIAEVRKLMTPSDATLQNMRDPKNRQVDANFDAAIAP
jgi:hypothetical protein